jgi:hypothetical protein
VTSEIRRRRSSVQYRAGYHLERSAAGHGDGAIARHHLVAGGEAASKHVPTIFANVQVADRAEAIVVTLALTHVHVHDGR